MVYEWDVAETLLNLIKHYRPDRNGRKYLADLVDLVHNLLRLIKVFLDPPPPT